jgi:hypothetical protein
LRKVLKETATSAQAAAAQPRISAKRLSNGQLVTGAAEATTPAELQKVRKSHIIYLFISIIICTEKSIRLWCYRTKTIVPRVWLFLSNMDCCNFTKEKH